MGKANSIYVYKLQGYKELWREIRETRMQPMAEHIFPNLEVVME